jgi:adenylyltransferase/sulfurtransferase
MTPDQRARYARHLRLPEFGEAGQERLLASRVLIVGLGGLGSPVAMYLAASGVGCLALTDYDQVEVSNLQRQIIHGTGDVGRLKVESARDAIARLNPEVQVDGMSWSLDEDELAREVERADLVVDACDNFETRFVLNAFSRGSRTPLVSGAALRLEGQVAVFDPRDPESPCYRCLYEETPGAEGEACAEVGVLAPLLGVVGSIQAVEALKLLAGAGESLAGRIVLVDALGMGSRTLRLRRDSRCPACGPG